MILKGFSHHVSKTVWSNNKRNKVVLIHTFFFFFHQVTACIWWETADARPKASLWGSPTACCPTSTGTNWTSSASRSSGRTRSRFFRWRNKTSNRWPLFEGAKSWDVLNSLGCSGDKKNVFLDSNSSGGRGLPSATTTSGLTRRTTLHRGASTRMNYSACRSMRSSRWRRWWGRAAFLTSTRTAKVKRGGGEKKTNTGLPVFSWNDVTLLAVNFHRLCEGTDESPTLAGVIFDAKYGAWQDC